MRLHGALRWIIALVAALCTGCVGASSGDGGDNARPEAAASASTDSAEATARQTYAALMLLPMQARASEAVEGLRALDETALYPGQARIRACMLERFGSEAPEYHGSGWPDSLISAYQRYWRRSILDTPGSGGETAARVDLFEETRALAGPAGAAARSLDALEPHVLARLEAHGLHAQLGVTPPLRELMIWGSQTSRRERVVLPSGAEEVVVELMADFLSRGWSHYATCGRSSAGGWVGADRLFAMADRYDLDSEEYRVGYLGHEAQHFRDQREFASSDSLVSWRLEYRAKLAQLAMLDSTQASMLSSFIADRGGDPSFPHNYANGRVVADLEAALLPGTAGSANALLDLPGRAVRDAAARLLEEDSRALAATVRSSQ